MEKAESIGLFSGKGLLLLAVGLMGLAWLIYTPPGLLGKADAIGYAVCHRIDLRSFHLGERPLPLCVRCSGMYLAAVLGIAYQTVFSRKRAARPPWSVLAVLGLLALAFIIDGLNSYLHLPFFTNVTGLYEPQNWLRLLTGSGMGLAVAIVVFPAFNQTVWKGFDNRPAVAGLGSLGVLLLLTLVVDGLLLTENPFLLYPLALISAGGVVGLLTLIYSMLWVMIFRLENRCQRLRDLWLPLVAGFGTAMLQIALIDLVRFALTGTWDGFHFG